MIDHIKYSAWEFLTSFAMVVDGLVGMLTLGVYRGRLHMYVMELRTSGTVQYPEDKDWDTSDDGVCQFFTAKRK